MNGQLFNETGFHKACATLWIIFLSIILVACANAPQPTNGASVSKSSKTLAVTDKKIGNRISAAKNPVIPFSLSANKLLQLAQSEKPSNASDGSYVVRQFKKLFIQADGRSNLEIHAIFRVLSQADIESFSMIRIPYSPWFQEPPHIKARVVQTDGSVFELSAETIGTSPVYENNLIMSDREMIVAALPQIRVGSVVEYVIQIHDKKPQLVGGFGAQISLYGIWPGVYRNIEVSADPGVSLHIDTFGLPPHAVTRTKGANGGELISVSAENTAPFPRVGFIFNSPSFYENLPGISIGTAKNWNAVAVQYSEILDSQNALGPIRNLALSSKGKRLRVIQNAVTYLHDNVRYTGLEFGESAIIPRPPAEVLQSGLGDCKEKALVLVKILERLNIKAHVALVRSQTLPDIQPDSPGFAFDHAIVFLPDDKLWIDATAQLIDVGLLPPNLYGRNALVVSPSSRELVQIPEIIEQPMSRIATTVEIGLKDFGKDELKITRYSTGLESASWKSIAMQNEKQAQEATDTLFSRLFENITLEMTSLSGALNNNEGVAMTAIGQASEIVFKDFSQGIVVLQLGPLFEQLPRELLDGTPEGIATRQSLKTAVPDNIQARIPYTFSSELTYRVRLPAGYVVTEEPPELSHQDMGILSYTRNYKKLSNGEIEYRFELSAQHQNLSQDDLVETMDKLAEWSNLALPSIQFENISAKLLQNGDVLGAYDQLQKDNLESDVKTLRLARILMATGLYDASKKLIQTLEGSQQILPVEVEYAKSMVHMFNENGRQVKSDVDRNAVRMALDMALEHDPEHVESRLTRALSRMMDSYGEINSTGEENAIASLDDFKFLEGITESDPESIILMFVLLSQDSITQETMEILKHKHPDFNWPAYNIARTVIHEDYASALKQSSRHKSDTVVRAVSALTKAHRYNEAATFVSKLSATNKYGSLESLATNLKAAAEYQPPQNQHKPGNIRNYIRDFLYTGLSQSSDDALRSYYLPESLERTFVEDELMEFRQARVALEQNSTDMDYFARKYAGQIEIETHAVTDSISYVEINRAEEVVDYTFIERRNGKLFLLGSSPAICAEYAFDALKAGNLDLARTWINLAKEVVQKHEDWKIEPQSENFFGGLAAIFSSESNQKHLHLLTAALMSISDRAREALPALMNYHATEENDQVRKNLATAILFNLDMAEQFDDGLDFIKSIESDEQTAQPTDQLKSVMYYGAGDWQALKICGERQIKRNPESVSGYKNIVFALGGLGRVNEARKLLDSVDDFRSKSRSLIMVSAWVDVLDNAVDNDTIRSVDRALDDWDDVALNHLHTAATVYAMSGQLAKAKKALQDSIRLSLDDEIYSSAYLVKGILAEQLGQTEFARESYRKVKVVNPLRPFTDEYTVAQNRLAGLSKI